MPLRANGGLRDVSRAPTRDGGSLQIGVNQLSRELANWWDEYVQEPWIDHDGVERADHGWNWPWRILNIDRLIGKGLGQVPWAFAVGAESASRIFIPCVLSLLIQRYPALNDHSQKSVFVWYLSAAPDEFFERGRGRELGAVPKALGSIGMDVAITRSYNLMHNGRVGLHASPAGKASLMKWYQDSNRMNPLPKNRPLPPGIRGFFLGNDGRYFYHDEATAFAASSRMDNLR